MCSTGDNQLTGTGAMVKHSDRQGPVIRLDWLWSLDCNWHDLSAPSVYKTVLHHSCQATNVDTVYVAKLHLEAAAANIGAFSQTCHNILESVFTFNCKSGHLKEKQQPVNDERNVKRMF